MNPMNFKKNTRSPSPKNSNKIKTASALTDQGEWIKAETLAKEVLIDEPKNFDALHTLGVIAAQTNRADEALVFLNQAIAINSKHAGAHNHCGIAHHLLKQFEVAIQCFDQALLINPQFPQAHNNRGNAMKELGQLQLALASYDQAIQCDQKFLSAHYNRGNLLREVGQFNDAILSYDKALQINPHYADAQNNRGLALYELNQPEQALASIDLVLAINPNHLEALNNRGLALVALNRSDEAIQSYEKVIALNPSHAEAINNLGLAFAEQNRLDEALASHQKALVIRPNFAGAQFNFALSALLLGRFDEGWKAYEERWALNAPGFKEKRHFPKPLWLGQESLANKTILLVCEQGFGDTIQFARYAKLVANLGAKVILEVQKPLLTLLTNLEGVTTIIARGDTLPAFDFYCPLLSLPLALKTSLDNIPSASHYITANQIKMAQWIVTLGLTEKPRVGIVWSGNSQYKNNHNRNILLADLIRYLPNEYQLISFQKEVQAEDQATLLAHPEILHFENDLHDFSDTAALCDLMDLVITVDTSVAHLAGALGKTTWVLLPFHPDWRWLLDRDTSPWYPNTKLIRQKKIGSWDGIF